MKASKIQSSSQKEISCNKSIKYDWNKSAWEAMYVFQTNGDRHSWKASNFALKVLSQMFQRWMTFHFYAIQKDKDGDKG